MPTTVQFRRGTTGQNNSFTGAAGEITINTTKKTAVVHDGSTAGGSTLISENDEGYWSAVTNTDIDSAIENVDSWSASTYRSAKYVYQVSNTDKTEYQSGEILVIHDGTTAYLTEYAKMATGNNDLITFTVDINSGNVRLRAQAQAPNSALKARRLLQTV
tara:strand:+ start:250 stop:729 length:480 start_codon:yes stop_codon:yes gene_type:complete